MPPVWLQIIIALYSLLALCLRIALQIFHGKFETLAYPRSYTHSYSFSPWKIWEACVFEKWRSSFHT